MSTYTIIDGPLPERALPRRLGVKQSAHQAMMDAAMALRDGQGLVWHDAPQRSWATVLGQWRSRRGLPLDAYDDAQGRIIVIKDSAALERTKELAVLRRARKRERASTPAGTSRPRASQPGQQPVQQPLPLLKPGADGLSGKGRVIVAALRKAGRALSCTDLSASTHYKPNVIIDEGRTLMQTGWVQQLHGDVSMARYRLTPQGQTRPLDGERKARASS